MRIQDLTKEKLNELIDRLLYYPSFVTAADKRMLGQYLIEILSKEKQDAISSED